MSYTPSSTGAHAILRIGTYLRRSVRIDGRSLALFRVLIALLVIGDVLSRARNFSFYYTDDGPVSQELAESWTGEAFSFFYYTSDPTILGALFAVHAGVALLLLIGYKTRLMALLTFLFVISLDHHNPLVLSYADTLFRLLTFWAVFLPLGARWSVDAVHRGEPRKSFVGIASAAVMIQMVLMYFINATNKHGSSLWRDGEAAIIVFGIDEMTFLLGNSMRAIPEFIQLGGWVWFTILFASPLLILLQGRWRLPLLLTFMGGHLSFAITVRIGAFAYVALAGLLLFIPREFYDDVGALARRVTLAQLFTAIRPRAVRVATRLPAFSRGIRHPTVLQLRHATYTVFMLVLVVSVAMILVLLAPHASLLWENVEEPHPDDIIQDHSVGEEIYDRADQFGVTQPEWSIFAGPGPRSNDRYYVFPAVTTDGEQIDIYNGDRELAYDRPTNELQTQHGAYRERFYMNSVRRSNRVATALADHLCETWEGENGEQLTQLQMYEITERITVDTIGAPELRERSSNRILSTSCQDARPQIIEPPNF